MHFTLCYQCRLVNWEALGFKWGDGEHRVFIIAIISKLSRQAAVAHACINIDINNHPALLTQSETGNLPFALNHFMPVRVWKILGKF